MTPNLGTKGNGEPVVQPAECKCVSEGCQGLLSVCSKFRIQVALPVVLLVLAACGQAPSPVSVIAQPQSLAYTGGQVSLSWDNWNVAGARYYTLSSDPQLPGLPLNITSNRTTISISRNPDSSIKSYRLTLEAYDLSGSAPLARKTVDISLEGQLACHSVVQSAQSQSLTLAAPQPGVARFDVPHVAGRLMVYSKPGVSLQSNVNAQNLGASLAQSLGNGWSVYNTQPGQEASVASNLVKQGVGQYVQPEYLYTTDGLSTPPNNRDYAQAQSGLFKQMNLEQAWSELQDSCNQPVVAVVDTGVYSRSDLTPNLTPKASWLDVVGDDLEAPKATQGQADPGQGTGAGHGTGVAGVIAASTNDGSALTGAAYNLVKVLPIKVFDNNRVTGTVQIAQALEYAAGSTTIAGQVFTNPYPARVVNLSLSLDAAGFSDPYLESVLQRLTQQGVVVVASSGNTDSDSVSYPASSAYVIAVGATNAKGARAQWLKGFASNYGSDLEFVAPGTSIPVLQGSNKDDYGMAYGTSAAAPFISATIGLYLVQNQQSGRAIDTSTFAAQVRSCLQSASQNGRNGWNAQTGYGLVDASKVVDLHNTACYPKG